MEKSFNKRSPISESEVYHPEQAKVDKEEEQTMNKEEEQTVNKEEEEEQLVRPDFSDERYRTVVVEKENNQLGFCVKVLQYIL